MPKPYRLSWEDKKKIMELWIVEGISRVLIAKRYGVQANTISRVIADAPKCNNYTLPERRYVN